MADVHGLDEMLIASGDMFSSMHNSRKFCNGVVDSVTHSTFCSFLTEKTQISLGIYPV